MIIRKTKNEQKHLKTIQTSNKTFENEKKNTFKYNKKQHKNINEQQKTLKIN